MTLILIYQSINNIPFIIYIIVVYLIILWEMLTGYGRSTYIIQDSSLDENHKCTMGIQWDVMIGYLARMMKNDSG